MMWIGGGVFYGAAMLALLVRAFADQRQRARHSPPDRPSARRSLRTPKPTRPPTPSSGYGLGAPTVRCECLSGHMFRMEIVWTTEYSDGNLDGGGGTYGC